MGLLVRIHDAPYDLVVKEVGRHSRIDDQGLRVDSRRTGADQECGDIGRFLGFPLKPNVVAGTGFRSIATLRAVLMAVLSSSVSCLRCD